MSKESSKMQSWQVFHYARKRLGNSTLYAIFGKKNARAVDFWCQNPRTTGKEETAYDPIQGVKNLLEALDDLGHCDVVRSAIAFLISGTSLECGVSPRVVDPRPTITEEILLDYKAVANLQAAIEAGETPEEVEEKKQTAIAELDRTIAKYREDFHR